MITDIQTPYQSINEVRFWHPVGLTALLYLKDALLEENYEDCKDIIAVAREFGAESYEIQNVLRFYAGSSESLGRPSLSPVSRENTERRR